MEDPILFLKRDCPASKDFPTWSPKEADTLIEFYHYLSVKFFEPMLILEKSRIKVAKSCKAKAILEKTYPSYKDYYKHCPKYRKVLDSMNKDVARVTGDDPQLNQLLDDIIATEEAMADEIFTNLDRMSDLLNDE